jgi:hypothetical protein
MRPLRRRLHRPHLDRGHLRLLLLIGSFGVVFGFMMLSLCTEFWQALLAQGFVIGLGGGMLFVPSVAILPTYFSTKIGLAIGLAASGSSMGGERYTPAPSVLVLITDIPAQASSTPSSSTASSPESASAGPSASSASWPSPPCSSPSLS